MPQLSFFLEGDGCWPDLKDGKFLQADNEKPVQVAVLDAGMASGRPSVSIRMELPDGQTILGETSARLFCICAKGIMAKYPNLFTDEDKTVQ
jgi:hypothetical protein